MVDRSMHENHYADVGVETRTVWRLCVHEAVVEATLCACTSPTNFASECPVLDDNMLLADV